MPRRRLLLAAVLLAAACGQAEQREPAAAPSPAVTAAASRSTSAGPPPSPPAAPPPAAPAPAAARTWVVGASPLPLRPDGFGEVLPTPEVLRDRALTDPGTLPAPPGGVFRATIEPIGPEVRGRMGRSWSPECPVGLGDLRHVTVSFRGFDVVSVFRRLFAADFPLEQMRLIEDADLDAPPTGDGNNTAGYVCRAARGHTRWSQHAYGTAVDVNPFHNPLVRRGLVLPELASAYVDRAWVRPGMHAADGPAVRAFDAIGWTWGGTWRSSKDYMHFSLNGR